MRRYLMEDDIRNEKYEVGRLGEREASKYLKKNRFRIIKTNEHAGKSEIDIIAVRKDTLVFIEVKTRSYSPDKTYCTRPADAVNKEKITYLIRGADRFCRENGSKYANYFKRFDIIEVYLDKIRDKYKVREIKHFENAFGRNG